MGSRPSESVRLATGIARHEAATEFGDDRDVIKLAIGAPDGENGTWIGRPATVEPAEGDRSLGDPPLDRLQGCPAVVLGCEDCGLELAGR